MAVAEINVFEHFGIYTVLVNPSDEWSGSLLSTP